MNTLIQNKQMDEERALYHLQQASVINCVFDGPADGESALKESNAITVQNSRFALRYPLWHTSHFALTDCIMEETCRAPLWYACQGKVSHCQIDGVKCLRECKDIHLTDCHIASPEFGWKCRNISLEHCEVISEYFALDSQSLTIDDLTLKGKYSFQYTQKVVVRDSVLDTKDAFWHAKNVRVENCLVKGEYLGWYSENLTFVNCRIIGTQPLCYCKGLKLQDCTMEETDLAFEYSQVEADVQGHILSVKNPHAGFIVADGIGEIIQENSVMENSCNIQLRNSGTGVKLEK